MNYKISSLFFIVLFLVMSCSNKFEYQDRILSYLDDNTTLNKGEPKIIIIISGGCGQCDKRTINLVKGISQIKQYDNFNKTIILPTIHKSFYDQFSDYSFNVVSDSSYLMRRYGIEFEKNLLLELDKNNKTKYWQWLYMQDFFDVAKRYKIKDL